jgi:hypothetical protein
VKSGTDLLCFGGVLLSDKVMTTLMLLLPWTSNCILPTRPVVQWLVRAALPLLSCGGRRKPHLPPASFYSHLSGEEKRKAMVAWSQRGQPRMYVEGWHALHGWAGSLRHPH